MDKPGESWSIADAKARLSEVVERAHREGPQTITRHGRRAAVLVSAEQWDRENRKGTLLDFFRTSPLRGSGIDLARLPDGPRDLDL